MSTLPRWLLVMLLGLKVHMLLVIFGMVTLSPNRNQGLTAMVIPFGQVSYDQITNVALIEWGLILIIWICFAFAFLRQPAE